LTSKTFGWPGRNPLRAQFTLPDALSGNSMLM
jgi:hypothetical protein